MTQKGVSSSAHVTREARTPRSRASTAVCSRARDTCDCDSVATGEGVLRMLQRTRNAGGTHRIQVIAWQSVLQTGLRQGDPFHRCLRDIPAWRRGHLSALWHGDPQLKHFWGRVTCRREGNRYRCRAYGRVHDRVWHGTPRLQVALRQGLVTKGHLSALWHGDPTHRCLSGILAWQRGLLDGLRQGDPFHRCLSGILAEPL